jgi:hypothetical protein
VKTADSEAQFEGALNELIQHSFMLRGVPHDSLPSHLSFPHLELRLEETDDISVTQKFPDRRKHLEDRDEGKVQGDNIRPFRKVPGRQIAGVFLHEHTRGRLSASSRAGWSRHRRHTIRALLKEAVREPPVDAPRSAATCPRPDLRPPGSASFNRRGQRKAGAVRR